MDVKIEPSWKQILAPEFESEYFGGLADFVRGLRCARGGRKA